MKKTVLLACVLLLCAPLFAQTGAVQGHCYLGGTKAVTSGLKSSNYMNGIIPSCTVTVYLTGTQTLASITNSQGNSNPFTSNTSSAVDPGGWIFSAATNQGLDVVMSGGIAPNTYPQPVTLVDVFPSQSFTPVSGLAALIGTSPIAVNNQFNVACNSGTCTVSCPTCTGQSSLISQIQYPSQCAQGGGTDQCVAIYPNGATTTGTQLCGGGQLSAVSTVDAASPFSGSIQRFRSGTVSGCPQFATITWNGSTLPSYIVAANVGTIFGGVIASQKCALNGANSCGFFSMTVNGSSVGGSLNSFPAQTFLTTLCSGGSCTSHNYSADQWIAQNSSTLNWIGSGPFGGSATYTPVLILDYTGTAPPATTQIRVASPLIYNQGLLSFDPCFDCAIDTGADGTAYAATLTGVSVQAPGIVVSVFPAHSNSTTTPTFSLNGSAPLTIVLPNGNPLSTSSGGDISASHQMLLQMDGGTNPGTWQLLNPRVSGSGSAFSGGLGSSYQDVGEIAAPANPAAGNERLYANSTTHQLSCLTSSGGNCLASAGGAPGGSSGDFQFNNASSFGGGTGLTYGGAAGQIKDAMTDAITGLSNDFYGQFNMNNLNLSTQFNLQQPGTTTAPLAAGVSVPSTGTIHQAEAIIGLANNQSATTNTVGAYYATQCAANGASCWGDNPLAASSTGLGSGTHLYGEEVDVNANNTADVVHGILVWGAWSQQPSAATGVEIAEPAGSAGKWGAGFMVDDRAATTWSLYAGATVAGGSIPIGLNTSAGTASISADNLGNIDLVPTSTKQVVISNLDVTGTCTGCSGTRLWSCQPGLGDGANAITAATYHQTTCKNTTGSTVTLTAIQCFTDNNGSSTMNVTNSGGTGLLTGAVTCTNSFAAGTQSATTTLSNNDYLKFTFVADGTSEQTTWVVGGTY